MSDVSGVYLTNGAFLYRVAGIVATDAGEMVEIEDCFWLEVVRIPLSEFRLRDLRVVTPEPAELAGRT